jgi:hypothetical protein
VWARCIVVELLGVAACLSGGGIEPSVPLERLVEICWGQSDISAGQKARHAANSSFTLGMVASHPHSVQCRMAPIRVDGGLPSVDHGNSGPFWAAPKDDRATATIGASDPLPSVPARVGSLNW